MNGSTQEVVKTHNLVGNESAACSLPNSSSKAAAASVMEAILLTTGECVKKVPCDWTLVKDFQDLQCDQERASYKTVDR